jgi:hypothetical protein
VEEALERASNVKGLVHGQGHAATAQGISGSSVDQRKGDGGVDEVVQVVLAKAAYERRKIEEGDEEALPRCVVSVGRGRPLPRTASKQVGTPHYIYKVVYQSIKAGITITKYTLVNARLFKRRVEKKPNVIIADLTLSTILKQFKEPEHVYIKYSSPLLIHGYQIYTENKFETIHSTLRIVAFGMNIQQAPISPIMDRMLLIHK